VPIVTIHTFHTLYFAALGLLVGSYLNVVIYRLPRRISTVLPRSRCPRCLFPIRPWDNIPLLSYLVLRGRCRHCGMVIPWRYPAIEAMTGVCFALCYHRFGGVTLEALVAAGFCAVMVVLAMIDMEHYVLPDVLTLPGIVLGLVLQPWLSWTTPRAALLGALAGAGILYAVAWGWYFFRGVWGMGMGDVKMLAMIGAFLGWSGVLVTLFLSSLGGSLVGGALLLKGRMRMQSKLPFGAFLGFAAIGVLFFGRQLLAGYLGVTADFFD